MLFNEGVLNVGEGLAPSLAPAGAKFEDRPPRQSQSPVVAQFSSRHLRRPGLKTRATNQPKSRVNPAPGILLSEAFSGAGFSRLFVSIVARVFRPGRRRRRGYLGLTPQAIQ